MRLSPARFNALLRSEGQQVAWRRASMCPCRSAISGAADPSCPQCGGRGTLWGDAIAAWTGVAALRVTRQFADFTRWESGDVMLSIPAASPLWSAGEHDRILMSQSSEPFQIVLTNDGAARLDFPIASIDRCFWLRAGDRSIAEGVRPLVGPNGALSWADPTTAPDLGQQFSLRGRKVPEFFIWQDLPQDRSHFGGLPLPRRVVARRFDLFGR